VLKVVCGAYRVHDPQNLGAICRSGFVCEIRHFVFSNVSLVCFLKKALFFGVEQLVLSEAKSGTLSSVTSVVSSASAGAAEFLPITQVFPVF
jgi:tRNA G18 (ribose-2'-O)-methylase SpoU